MNDSRYAFYLPPLVTKENQLNSEDMLNKALRYTLESVGYEIIDEASSLIIKGVERNKILIILSGNEKKLKRYMTEILEFGYGGFRENTGLGENTRYLFIDNGNRPFLFDALLSILACLGLAVAETPDRLFHGIRKVIDSFNPKINPTISPLTSKDLQDHIERSCVPSGAEEIQELLFRDASKAHDLFSDIGGESYALRMLLGACLSGELTPVNLRAAIRKINENRNYEFTEDILTWLKDLGKKRKRLKISEKNKTRLSDYLENRKILLIEDQLTEHHWDIALPVLLGATARKKIKAGKPKKVGVRGQKIGSVRLWHAFNARDALDRYKNDLKKFDIILLDLFSSAKKAESQTDHKSLTLSTLGLSVKELTEKIKGLYLDQAKEGNHVPSPLPQIVVFSVDSEGVTARTLFKELGAVDYFFKTTRGEPHKRAYYASFRNTLIKALKDNASHVSGIPYSDKFNRFDEWLRQFFPQHRPIILRLMKHFRYYSAMSITKMMDKYVKNLNLDIADGRISLFGSRYLDPTQFWFSYLGRPTKSGPATLVLMGKTKWIDDLKIDRMLLALERRGRQPQFKEYDDLQRQLVEDTLVFGADQKYGLCLVFVDDVIGSGGQLKSYLEKFMNEHLVRATKDIISDRVKQVVWRKICNVFLSGTIQIHVLFAIGIRNTILESMLKNIEIINRETGERNEFSEEKLKSIKTGCRSLFGLIEVNLCNNLSHGVLVGDQNCTCNDKISVHVHIADYADNVFDICENEGITDSTVKGILSRYVFIVRPRREKEYPCDFEPLGWEKCGGLVATYANTPGNTLPIIWGDRNPWGGGNLGPWIPIFPRFFNLWAEGSTEIYDLHCKKHRKCKLRPYAWEDIVLCGNQEPPCKS